jgi:hypothetical protein
MQRYSPIMKTIQHIFALLLLTLTGCGDNKSGCTAENIVKAMKPELQLTAMLKATVKQTHTFAIKRQSDVNIEKNLQDAVETVVRHHIDQWNQNLMQSWATLNPVDLNVACKALSNKDQAALMAIMSDVGDEVQLRNEPLLKQAGVDVLKILDSQ